MEVGGLSEGRASSGGSLISGMPTNWNTWANNIFGHVDRIDFFLLANTEFSCCLKTRRGV